MKTKVNPAFLRQYKSCADLLANAGPKVNFSTLKVGDYFISRDVHPREGAIYFKMKKTGDDSAELRLTFHRFPYWIEKPGSISGDMVVTSCSPVFGDPLALPF